MPANTFEVVFPEYIEGQETETRAADGTVKLRNPHVKAMPADNLYHISLATDTHDLVEMFSDVKFVCMGGTPKRMEAFAYYVMKELNQKLPTGTTLQDISRHSYRYSMFKVGPVLSISHGMGIPSVSIMLHEVIKLMYYAKVKDPIFFRLGTCGGIGVEGGNIVLTETAVDGMLNPYLELPVLGKMQRRPSLLDRKLAEEIKTCSVPAEDGFETFIGKTMCTYDFYEGQARLDGAFCEYSEADKLNFLRKIKEAGVINMEMESLAFAALCTHAGIKGAVVCVALLNRLNGDQISTSHDMLEEWQSRPMKLVVKYMKKKLSETN